MPLELLPALVLPVLLLLAAWGLASPKGAGRLVAED